MAYSEEYKQHQIIVNEGGSENGYPIYDVKIKGWLNKNKDYENSVRVGFKHNKKVPAELIAAAKEAIDNRMAEIEQEAIFKRKLATTSSESSQLKSSADKNFSYIEL